MLKKFLTILALCAVILSVGIVASADEITWAFDDTTDVLTIKGSGRMTEAEWNDEIDITEVAEIVIENGITSICDNAFCIYTEEGDLYSYTNLTTVEIPESVTEIGVRAFAWAVKLENVKLPSNLKKLGMIAFIGTGIKEITIPSTITQWDRTVFGMCVNLKDVTIGGTLTKIPEYTFYGCEALVGVTIPDSVVAIDDYAFSDCVNLEWVEIPYGVVSIGEYAFENCEKLTSLMIPASVEDLEYSLCNGYLDEVIYRGTKADWDKIKGNDLGEGTELVCNSDALAFTLKVTGEQADFSWNMIPGVLSYGLSIFKGDDRITGTEINEINGDMSFACLLEDGKYTARLMLLTEDFSGRSEFIDFYIGDGMLKSTYALTALSGEMSDGRFYAEAEVVERYDRSESDMFVIAVYKDGVMLDMVYMKGDLISGQPFKFGGMLEGEEGAEIKAFVWDSMDGMKTLSNVVSK